MSITQITQARYHLSTFQFESSLEICQQEVHQEIAVGDGAENSRSTPVAVPTLLFPHFHPS